MSKLSLLLAAAASVGASFTSLCPAVAQPASRPDSAEQPGTGQIMEAVRRAVGYRHLRAFRSGIALTEQAAGASTAETVLIGTSRGAIRSGDGFGFDGNYRWQHDQRWGAAIPSPQRLHEKNAWPIWIRGHWWLNPASGIRVEVDPATSGAEEVALRLTLPEGLVPATVYVNRSTWLPMRFSVPYEHGPFEARLSDWRPVRGVLLPFAVDSSYRERRSEWRVVTAAPVASAADFTPPSAPADYHFDSSLPPAPRTLAGAPFPSGTPGHVYVAASADGRAGWWHFDSGSDSMIIDEAVADSLGMEVIGKHRSMGADGTPREGTWRRGRTFSIGSMTIERPVFRAMDLSANNAPPGERRMGTIGYDLFARSVVEYARGGHEVRICDGARYRLPRGGRWQRLEHIDATPAVRALVEGRLAGLFQVDTGSAGSIDFAQPFHERHRLTEGREGRDARVLGSGGSFAVRVGRLARFDFAGRRWDNLEVSFRTGGVSREGSAGTLGRELLEPFRTVFDYGRHRIAFLPLAAGPGRCG